MSNNNDELLHYGVLGMKWGVRKNPSKAYNKATTKADELKTKSTNLRYKSAALQKKALKKEMRATSERKYKKARKMQFKANKLNLKSAKKSKQYDKWVKRMENAFADVRLSDISKESIETGKAYAYMLAK